MNNLFHYVKYCRISLLSVITVFFFFGAAKAQTTEFSYQGRLSDAGNPANSTYDMQFMLYDTAEVGTGTQQGVTVTNPNVAVANGAFSVSLDFGPGVFDGAARYIEIGVRPAGNKDPYTTLSPRQPVSSTPYAIRSLAATAADGLSVACVSGVTSSQIQDIQGTQITSDIPVASIPAGNNNYIQNTTKQQVAANFTIDGDGVAGGTLSANVMESATQFNLAGNRIL